MPHNAGPSNSDLQALEYFVVENDDLAELEARIGRFNIFDALDVTRAEIRHSNFLAWLLDPNESHGQGGLFLKAVLMDLLRNSPPGLRPFSPVELDGAQLRGVELRREWRRIDILITCKAPPFVVAVENKVDSGEHGDQLRRYEEEVAHGFADLKPLFVFLTKHGTEASRNRWVSYSYADIHRVLDRCRRANAASIGGDVAVFLDHYLSLIGSRFMNDEKIDELCQRIYRNHRRALELIFQKIGTPATGIVGDLEELLRGQSDRWHVTHRYEGEVGFVPRSWLDLFPSIAAKYDSADSRAWVRLGFSTGLYHGANTITFWCYAYPTTDPPLRRRVLERLTQDVKEFGLRSKRKVITDKFTRLAAKSIVTWPEADEPDKDAILAAAAKKLNEAWEQFSGVAEALRPIFNTTNTGNADAQRTGGPTHEHPSG